MTEFTSDPIEETPESLKEEADALEFVSDTEEGETEAGEAAGEQTDAAKKRKPRKKMNKKKVGIICGVVAAVLIVAGIGFSQWHQQPSFCAAICHSPMDKYYESYMEGDGMARIHKEANVTCLDCHEANLSTQISEGAKWVTGNYTDPLRKMDYDSEQCLTCHISEEFQAAKTDLIEKNPHADAHQSIPCTDCHSSHKDQTDYCSSCHDSGGQRMITFPLEGHEEEAA